MEGKEMDYEKTAVEILKEVGGEKNVVSLTNCMTRLRFVLKDESIVSDEAVKMIDGVMGVARKGGQFQLIIGPNVSSLYDVVAKKINKSSLLAEEESIQTQKVVEKITAKKIGAIITGNLNGFVLDCRK